MPGDGTCPKLLELLPVLEPHAAAMDRESRQEKAPAPGPAQASKFKLQLKSLEWDQDSPGSFEIRNPPASSRTSPILAWLPNAPRTLHPLISQPPPTTLCPRS